MEILRIHEDLIDSSEKMKKKEKKKFYQDSLKVFKEVYHIKEEEKKQEKD